MINNGWNATQTQDLFNLLRSTHSIRMIVRLMDLNHNYIDDLTPSFISGQVQVDADAEVSRSLDLTLIDPLRAIQLDPESPSPTGVYINHMISVLYQIISPSGVWFDVPVFCGPIDSVERDEVYLDIKCLGKESLALDNMWVGKTYKGKPIITEVIKDVFANVLGEVKTDIPDLPKKSNGPVHLKIDTTPWATLRKLANVLDRQLFYDGRGMAVLRKTPTVPVITLDEFWLSTPPVPGYDLGRASNAVEVTGGNPKGPKKSIVSRAVAPASHPLSPHRLARGNPPVPRFINPIRVQNTDLLRQKDADKYADDLLSEALLEAVTITADVGLPIPMLEEQDLVGIATDQVSTEFRSRKFTIPLVVGQDQAIGYVKRLTPRGKSPVRKRTRKPKKRDRRERRG